MLLEFLQTLQTAKLEVTPIEVAEALLLACFLPALEAPTAKEEPLEIEPPLSEPAQSPAPALQPEAASTTELPLNEPARAPLQPGDAVLPQPPASEAGSAVNAVPFRSPQARALPAAHKLGVALRPLRRRSLSNQRVVIDEEATVQQIADGGPKTIVWQRARERWLSVELILDESLSMHVWRHTLHEFRTLLERHGAFRGVRAWQLKTDEKEAQLWRVRAKDLQAARASQLLSPTERQLVIVVSDCTSQAWYHGSAYQLLMQWARRTPTVLTQVLPRSLWLGTSMTDADATMRADQPGLPNAKLHVEPDLYADWLKTGAPLPIITLDEWSIAPWAKMVAGSGQGIAEGFVLPDFTDALAEDEPLPAPEPRVFDNAAARVASFMGKASPLARQLARYLAVAPLSLPVLQLVQQAMLPQSRQSHLAEIFRSDLMNLPAPTTPLTEETIFDFHEGVREELLRDLTRRETLLVLDKVADFIFERSGQVRNLQALMVVPGGKESPPDAVQVDPLALSFARIGARTLRKLRVRTEQAEQWETFVQRYDPNLRVTQMTLEVLIEPETVQEPVTTPETIQPGSSPDDPWKGVFGGRSEANHRQLLATVTPKAGTNLFRIRLTVRTTSPQHPLRGKVTFFLHPSFGERRTLAVAETGIAELTLEGWGAFTVGVWADEGATLLELDLAELASAPQAFRAVPPNATPPIYTQPQAYEYACYLTCAAEEVTALPFVKEFHERLSRELAQLTDKPIFFAPDVLRDDTEWEKKTAAAIYQSACYLVLCIPSYFADPLHVRELAAMRRIAAIRQKNLDRRVKPIIPILLHAPRSMPQFIQDLQGFDLSPMSLNQQEWFATPEAPQIIRQIANMILDRCQRIGRRPDLFADPQQFQLPAIKDIRLADYKLKRPPDPDKSSLQDAADSLKLAAAALNRSNYEEARPQFEKALAIYRDEADWQGQIEALSGLGQYHSLTDNRQEALYCLTEALRLARDTKAEKQEAAILHQLGLVHRAQGNLKEMLQSYHEALAIFRRLHDQSGQIAVLENLGEFHLNLAVTQHLDNAKEAIKIVEEQLMLAREIDDQWQIGEALLKLGKAYEYLLELERARTYYTQASNIFAKLKIHERQAEALFALSQLLKKEGQHLDALTHGQLALTLYEQIRSERANEVKSFLRDLTQQVPPPQGESDQIASYSTFTFTTVTLDRHGKEIERKQLQARQFIEELAPGINLEMVEIPGGTFRMGSQETEADRSGDERQHQVTVSPFYMGKFTITQEQWRVIAADTSLKVKIDLDPKLARFKDKPDSARRPVEQVSWEDATEFCARLAKKTGRAYRLPTEAEWEYACRAETTTPFAFGETITPKIVNYDGNYPYAKAPKGEYRNETIPVGSLGVANAWGLFDMHGNVWEWCQDWYGEYKDEEQTDPTGPPTGEYRLLRGGSWNADGRCCRSAYRGGNDARNVSDNVGFRVVVAARTP